MTLEYDVSFTNHESAIPLMRVLNMESGRKALVKLEAGQEQIDIERLDEYLKRMMFFLGNKVKDYSFIIGLKNNKYGLVIEKKR